MHNETNFAFGHGGGSGAAVNRTALYARSATTAGDQDEGSTVRQIRQLERHADENGLMVVAMFMDEGRSGTDPEREGLVALLSLVRQREVDTVTVMGLDRLARSIELHAMIVETMQRHGVALVVADTPSTR